MLPTTITTAELRKLTGYAKSSITELQQTGIIERVGPDTWPIETVATLIAHLRTRRPAVSDDRARWEKARAIREERKVALEGRELCLMSDFATTQETMTALVFAAMDAAATRLHPHDRAERRRVEQEFTIAKECVSTAFRRLADDLTADPVSLMPSGPDIAAIRARLFPGGPATA